MSREEPQYHQSVESIEEQYPHTGPGDPKISSTALLDEIQRLASEKGGTPTQEDMVSEGKHAVRPYQDRFGTWSNALTLAGYEPNGRKNIPREELLDALRELSEELGRSPTVPEVDDIGRFSSSPYYRIFDSINDALEAASLPPIREMCVSEDKLIKTMRDLADELGHTPSASEMADQGKYSHKTYMNAFGTWNSAVEAAGLETWTPPTGEDNHQWTGGPAKYGEGWTSEKRQTVRERDGMECHGCSMTQEESLEQIGRILDVHHIVKAKRFDDPEKRNAMSNLITLCRPCHLTAEKMSPLYPFGPIR